MPIAAREKSGPVTDSASDRAGVDEIKVVFWEGPVLSCVVDFKHYVWWEPGAVNSDLIVVFGKVTTSLVELDSNLFL